MAVIYNMSHIDAMEGHEFEHFIANLLCKLGYENVEVTRGSGDQGVDVLAEKDGVRYAIQCKCYSSDLGNTPIQEVNTGKIIYHCHVGVVVTNRYFTQGAQEAAKATGVLLWDRSKLTSLIAQAGLEISAERPTQQKGENLTLWSGSPLLRRGGIALKDRDWKKAHQFFDRVLNTDPENAAAYLGLVMADAELSDQSAFAQTYINQTQCLSGNNFNHAKEFAGPELRAWFANLDVHRQKAETERRRKEAEAKAEAKAVAKRQRYIPLITEKRKKLALAAGLIAAGDKYTVGLRADGTLAIAGVVAPSSTSVDLHRWTDLVAIAAGIYHTVGLQADGTPVAAGDNNFGQCDIGGWTNLVAVAAGGRHTVGLRMDGTAVAVGYNEYGQCDTGGWENLVAVAAGGKHTVGLRTDGTAVAVGDNEYGQCDVGNWANLVAVAAGGKHTVGLRADGTSVATGCNLSGECDVGSWENLVDVVAGDNYTVGLQAFGTAVAAGRNIFGECDVGGWTDLVAIAAGICHTLGLRVDGTVVAAGSDYLHRRDNVESWKLFNSFETLEQERAKAKERQEAKRQRQETRRQRQKVKRQQQKAERQAKITALNAEKQSLQTELATLRGLFTGRRRREIEARLAELEQKINSLG